jgi:hypothetical protein
MGKGPMAYQHDVFVSYMHEDPMGSWVPDRLLPHLKTFVGNALGRHVSIFVDREGIGFGDSWPERLHQALATSRSLVAIWHPLYFHSKWCRKELGVMLRRESLVGLRTVQRPGGLVVPVCVNDGDSFPVPAKKVQSLDCRRYWRHGEAFTKTERYIEFQDRIEDWAPDVASAIKSAPAWDPAWLHSEWMELPDTDLHPVIAASAFPGLEA